MQTVDEVVRQQRELYQGRMKKPTMIAFCPNLAVNPKIGTSYCQEIGFTAKVPEHLANLECMKCKYEGGGLFIVYKNNPEVQKYIESTFKIITS